MGKGWVCIAYVISLGLNLRWGSLSEIQFIVRVCRRQAVDAPDERAGRTGRQSERQRGREAVSQPGCCLIVAALLL